MAVRFQLNQPLPSQPFAQGGSKPLTATSAAHQSTRAVLSDQLLHPRVHQNFRSTATTSGNITTSRTSSRHQLL